MTSAVISLVLLAAPTVGPPKDQVIGSGNSVTETRQLAEFDEIEFRVAGDFKVTIAEKATPLRMAPPCMIAAILAITMTPSPKRRLATQKSAPVFWPRDAIRPIARIATR